MYCEKHNVRIAKSMSVYYEKHNVCIVKGVSVFAKSIKMLIIGYYSAICVLLGDLS